MVISLVGIKDGKMLSLPWNDKLKVMHMVWKMNGGVNRKWVVM